MLSFGVRLVALTVTVLVIGGPANPINKNKPKLAKNAEKIRTNSRLCIVYSLICTDLKTGKSDQNIIFENNALKFSLIKIIANTYLLNQTNRRIENNAKLQTIKLLYD